MDRAEYGSGRTSAQTVSTSDRATLLDLRTLLAFVLVAIHAASCRSDPADPEGLVATPPVEISPVGRGASSPIIDGWFEDWPDDALVAVDPRGDAVAAFDVTRIHASTNGAKVYLRFDTGQLLNLYSGPPEDGTLVAVVRLPDGRELRLDFRARQTSVDGEEVLSWRDLDFVAAPSHAGRDFEVRFDLTAFGARAGQSISIGLEGSDYVAPVPVVLADPEKSPPSVLDTDKEEGAFRVASLNTREAGLTDPYRAPAMSRLLGAVAAEVYCLQELGTMPEQQIRESIAYAVDPGDASATWNVHAVSYGQYVRSAVVSRSPLVPIRTAAARFAGAVVLLDEGPVAVFSVHLKCCGYLDSDEDESRLWEADLLRRTIERLRDGAAGQPLLPYADAPVVVMGDFNDVGTPQLQGLFTEPPLELSHARPAHLRGPDVFTWFEPETVPTGGGTAAFPPAVLDLTFYDQLRLSKAFVVDSRRLDEPDLESLGLEPEDSAASDHLLVIADFGRSDDTKR